jgi:hypothetical protein
MTPEEFAVQAATMIREAVAKATAPLLTRINELEQRPAVAGPPGEPGEPGPAPSAEVIAFHVKQWLEANPPAAGKDGERGPEVSDERIERAVGVWCGMHPPRDGRDGLQGAKGTDGQPGRDGLSAEDFDLELADDGRTLSVHLRTGARVVTKSVTLAIPQYVGVHAVGKSYAKGDLVTHGGQMWAALAATEAEPGQGDAWRLATRKGRDGKDGARGEKGMPGRDAAIDPGVTVLRHGVG